MLLIKIILFLRIILIYFYLHILAIMLNQQPLQVSTRIRGRNFNGFIQIKENSLIFDIIEFKKGSLYTSQITNVILEEEFKRYLVFKKVEDLFDQLRQNKNLSISDVNSLIVPIQVKYKEKLFQLKIELPLTQIIFETQAQKMQCLFQKLQTLDKRTQSTFQQNQKIKKQKIQREMILQKKINQKQQILELLSIPKKIYFVGDQTNERFKSFQVTNNGRTIKKLGQSQQTIYNHSQPLSKYGIYQIKVIYKYDSNSSLIVGVCGRDIRSAINVSNSSLFMGYKPFWSNLFINGKTEEVKEVKVQNKYQYVFKMRINMNKKMISWFKNDIQQCSREIPQYLAKTEIYPMIVLKKSEETLQFVYK